jgi:hypothetical protein
MRTEQTDEKKKKKKRNRNQKDLTNNQRRETPKTCISYN